MAYPSEARLLVLHAIRVRGIVTDDRIAVASGLPGADVAVELDRLLTAGAVAHREGRLPGWSLTSEGRAVHAKLVADEIDRSGAGEQVAAAYRDFLGLNTTMLGVCTDWQLRRRPDGSQPINDHTDPDYDASVIARLHEVDDAVQPVCARLAAALDRYAGYGRRLAEARRRLDDGDTDWFTKPVIDSYHTVWFELHEDLLCTLGIERSKENV